MHLHFAARFVMKTFPGQSRRLEYHGHLNKCFKDVPFYPGMTKSQPHVSSYLDFDLPIEAV